MKDKPRSFKKARTCFAINCESRIPSTKIFCLHHWRMLPAATQRRVKREGAKVVREVAQFLNAQELRNSLRP